MRKITKENNKGIATSGGRNLAIGITAGVLITLLLTTALLKEDQKDQFVFSEKGFEVTDQTNVTFYNSKENVLIKNETSLYYQNNMYSNSLNGYVLVQEQTNDDKEYISLFDEIMENFNKNLNGDEIFYTSIYNKVLRFDVEDFDKEKLELNVNYDNIKYSIEITNVEKDFSIYEGLEEPEEELEDEVISNPFNFANDGFIVSNVTNDGNEQSYVYNKEENNTIFIEEVLGEFNYYLYDGINVYFSSNSEFNLNGLVFKSFLDAELTEELEIEYKEKMINLNEELEEMSLALDNNSEISNFNFSLLVTDATELSIVENNEEFIKATTNVGTINITNTTFNYEVETVDGELVWPDESHDYKYDEDGNRIVETSGFLIDTTPTLFMYSNPLHYYCEETGFILLSISSKFMELDPVYLYDSFNDILYTNGEIFAQTLEEILDSTFYEIEQTGDEFKLGALSMAQMKTVDGDNVSYSSGSIHYYKFLAETGTTGNLAIDNVISGSYVIYDKDLTFKIAPSI